MWCITIPSCDGYALQSKYVGLVTLMSTSPVLARMKPREKHVFPAPKSPPNKIVSPAVVPMDSMAPTSSISSGVGTDNLSVYASSLSLSVARILGSSGPNVEMLSGDCDSPVDDDTVLIILFTPPLRKARQPPEEDLMKR
mmetsp:Transcript_2319/g.6757  ORF Transcript_2319/g.6757 Transcript_2319/m.6757 type:complete len:140 (+) Transcript_2319:367-786(+)|eukprot:CAMPEP_0197726246 /NCGR_PEP_ID=MMETSP1434-20131217/14396_1 /TAXON_ID=265543 /ORGANISM="Minutocellus polymorphus, Strain CCMP3303" /LENGTH=139 /DNA_ID=CAMNT_0043312115 /DNA_START=359 /DNA_END=778 /DNA_ORIENTATION=-